VFCILPNGNPSTPFDDLNQFQTGYKPLVQ